MLWVTKGTPVGPEGSAVGLAGVNLWFHALTGVHFWMYHLTDWLGLIPFLLMFAFGFLGLKQWIDRKSIAKADRSILVLGGFYIAVLMVYILFEVVAVNHRPVLIGGVLEVSYPSSTTMLTMCTVPTAMMQVKEHIKHPALRRCIFWIMCVFGVLMLTLRLLSGVHWLTDIVGGALFSTGAVLVYRALAYS